MAFVTRAHSLGFWQAAYAMQFLLIRAILHA